jgi:hypothetical protein
MCCSAACCTVYCGRSSLRPCRLPPGRLTRRALKCAVTPRENIVARHPLASATAAALSWHCRATEATARVHATGRRVKTSSKTPTPFLSLAPSLFPSSPLPPSLLHRRPAATHHRSHRQGSQWKRASSTVLHTQPHRRSHSGPAAF